MAEEDGTESVLTLPGDGGDVAPPLAFVNDIKQDVKTCVLMEANEHSLEHIQTLITQGRFLELTQLERTDATWKSFIFNLPKGTMKFVLNASINTLPTKANLCLWGKRTNNKCRCGTKETLNHLLNCCQLALNEGRYTYRHDIVQCQYIASCLDTDKYTCYVDIPGHQTPAGGTLPPDVAISPLKPDIVIVDKQHKKVSICELTCPTEHRIDTAHKLKEQKYKHFETDVTHFKVSVLPFEVGSHTGFVSKDNKTRLASLHKFCKKSIKLKNFTNNISVICMINSLGCS